MQTYRKPMKTYRKPMNTYRKPMKTYRKPMKTCRKPMKTSILAQGILALAGFYPSSPIHPGVHAMRHRPSWSTAMCL